MTPEQEKALALARARRRRAEAEGKSPEMAVGMAELSGMTRNPRANDGSPAPEMGGPMPPPAADQAGLPGSVPAAQPAYRGFVAGADQTSSGINEGLARFAGFPVDAMTAGINGVGNVTGLWDAIEDPFGGSGTFLAAMDPLISDVAPQTAAQRYLRRAGQEVGFGVPAAMTGAALPRFGAPAREAMKYTGSTPGAALKDAAGVVVSPYMATSLAGDVGAGLAGQTAREIAPNSDTADFIASLLGGGGASFLASRMTPRLAAVPTLDELKAKANDAWQTVKGAPETLTDAATGNLAATVRQALPDSQLAQEAYPKAYGMADKMDTLKNPTVYDVEQARRMIGDRVAASPDEARVGVEMKRAIEANLAGLKPADLQGGAVDDTLDALSSARRTTHQVKKAEQVLNKEMRAETRAATTGTGGNEVNAMRQNVRALFDKERDPTLRGRRQGYSPAEMAAMERVVKGDAKSNIARLLGRMAPSSGALPMAAMGYGGAGGIGMAGLTGNPLLALPALAGGVGEVAKASAERMTRNQIADLLGTILNGGKAPSKSAARSAAEAAIIQQLLSSAAAVPQ